MKTLIVIGDKNKVLYILYTESQKLNKLSQSKVDR